MNKRNIGGLFLLLLLFRFSTGLSQNELSQGEKGKKLLDSISSTGLVYKANHENPQVSLSRDQALKYLQTRFKAYNWKDPSDPFRKAIGQLIFFSSNNSYDSTRSFLEKYRFNSKLIPWENFFVWDTLRIKIPGIKSINKKFLPDSLIKADTLTGKNLTDSAKTGIIRRDSLSVSGNNRPDIFLKDTIVLVIKDTLNEVSSPEQSFPFRFFNTVSEGDSIKTAINSLLSYMEERDSSIVIISGVGKNVIPVWLNSKNDRLARYWLKNEFSDSVTVWIGSVSRNTLGLFLEDGIVFRRPVKQSTISEAQLDLKAINSKNLLELSRNTVKPHFWKLHTETSFIFNQAALSNWVKGGDNSLALSSDMTGFADYTNKQLKLSSNNFARLKYGLLKTGSDPIRKNLDLLETNSKVNHKAFGKFDFSATMLFKTQIAKGFNYPNDSVAVSKFLNPAVLTIGLGLDYKPDKNTSLNFAPLSYKATFVTDTANIDQTKYGIPKNRRSMHEPGASLMITNEFSPYKTITITNRLQLFTNYIHNPQNIDVDWEMIATAKLNWFTDIRFNTHLIYDDDTKTPVLDKNKQPVLGPDGQPKRTARTQFKELLGLSFVFRF